MAQCKSCGKTITVSVGDEIRTPEGIGKIIAITKEWVIHETKDGIEEVAVQISDNLICITIDDEDIVK